MKIKKIKKAVNDAINEREEIKAQIGTETFGALKGFANSLNTGIVSPDSHVIGNFQEIVNQLALKKPEKSLGVLSPEQLGIVVSYKEVAKIYRLDFLMEIIDSFIAYLPALKGNRANKIMEMLKGGRMFEMFDTNIQDKKGVLNKIS